MKKIKLMKVAILFLAVFALSNCEEDGEIQFIVVDEFESTASIVGLQGASTFNINEGTNISDLLNTGSEFVEADVENVTIKINSDYSAETIGGDFKLVIGGATLVDQTLNLTKTSGTTVTIPVGSSNILASIAAGNINFTFSGTADAPIADDNFSLNLKFKIRAKVQ